MGLMLGPARTAALIGLAGSFVLNGQMCGYTPQPHVVASSMRPSIAGGGSTSLTVRLSRAPVADTILWHPSPAGGIPPQNYIAAVPVVTQIDID